MAKKTLLIVEKSEITMLNHGGKEYISLSDIAKGFGEPRLVIQNWMRTRNTVQFLGVWETINNPNFNREEYDKYLFEAGANSFSMSPTRWIETTNAIGVISKMGRGSGGAFAHKDIAFGFCYWLSPAFQLYLIQEFQRLKDEEAAQHKSLQEWNLKRTLAKVNYRIHTDAIKNHLIPLKIQDTKFEGLYYASEADLLNIALFGTTAKGWQETNSTLKGNMRDYATAEQLLVLANLENLNAEFIKMGLPKEERLDKLNDVAIYQMQLLVNTPSLKLLKIDNETTSNLT